MIKDNKYYSERKKVLVVCDGFLPPKVKVTGGKNLYSIQRRLSMNDYVVHLVVFIYKETTADWYEWKRSEETRYNIKFHIFNIPLRKIYPLHLFLSRAASFFIVLYLQIINKFDLIHEYSSSLLLINRTYLLGLLTGAKTVHTLCTINNGFTSSEKLLLRSTDRLICTTENMKNNLQKRVTGKIDLIPIPIDDKFFSLSKDNFRGRYNLKTEKIILFSGLLDNRKGIACFLRAIPEILHKNHDTSIIILTAPGLNNFPDSKRNREKVLFLTHKYIGRVIFIEEEIDIPSLSQAVDIHVYPPLTMHGTLGSPSILIEGMASGKAIIASNLTEITDIIKDMKNGLLFNSGDSKNLALCVNKLLIDKELREKLGQQARLDSQHYRLSLICERLTNLYNSLLNNHLVI